jgi:uncharacterized protein with HEPN domain
MKRTIQDFLNDILHYAGKAEEIYGSGTNAELSDDFLKIQSLVRCLEVIGEAVKMIPQETRDGYPEIPWKKWAGIRDVLIHKYWDLQEEVVFTTLEAYLPALKTAVADILRKIENEK